MGKLTRNDIKDAKCRKRMKVRLANSAKEVELLLTIVGMIVMDYYSRHPVLRFFAKLGVRSKKVQKDALKRAQDELSQVNYDYFEWYRQYGSALKQ